jgi:hypothetical protein
MRAAVDASVKVVGTFWRRQEPSIDRRVERTAAKEEQGKLKSGSARINVQR